jgi:hypothetical protein
VVLLYSVGGIESRVPPSRTPAHASVRKRARCWLIRISPALAATLTLAVVRGPAGTGCGLAGGAAVDAAPPAELPPQPPSRASAGTRPTVPRALRRVSSCYSLCSPSLFSFGGVFGLGLFLGFGGGGGGGVDAFTFAGTFGCTAGGGVSACAPPGWPGNG